MLVQEQVKDGQPHPRRKFDETVVSFCFLTMENGIGEEWLGHFSL